MRISDWSSDVCSSDLEEPAEPEAEIARRYDRAENRRAKLYQEIGEFLFAHDLDLTPLNFGLAHDYVTGNDRAVEQAVRALIMEKGRLTNGQAETNLAESRQEKMTPEAMAAMLGSVDRKRIV